jgi:methyltransferase (TIGR00027 family)
LKDSLSTNDSSIRHIADTALWVASYRALESSRPDALFHDPLAEILVGERGRRIAAAMPYPKAMAWALAIRTVAIDELIHRAISLGIDAVVNLGAGLDTRPYRMDLPASLRWIEVDFPEMISYKSEKLLGQRPVCRLEQISADFSDIPLRRSIFQRIGSETSRALILTEGVIAYMTAQEAAQFSRDIFEIPSFQYWIQDYYQGVTRRWAPRRMRRRLKETPFKFEEADPLGLFQQQGWTILENRYASQEARRLNRPFPFVFPWSLIMLLIPERIRKRWRSVTGYVMFQKPRSSTQL